MLDVNLVCNTQNRNDIVISTNFDPNYGVYMNAELKPQHVAVVCDCGGGYENGDYTYKGSTTLYTRNGPVDLKLYNLKCDACKCETTFLDEASTKGIFFYSNKTCTVEEIGWDFCFHGSEDKNFIYRLLHRNDTPLQNQFNQHYKVHEPKYISQVVFFLDICIQDRFQETH